MNTFRKISYPLGLILTLSIGFAIGNIHAEQKNPEAQIYPLGEFREISLIQFQEIEGDTLKTKISGPARILWNDSMVEKDGTYKIPLGQILTQSDLEFRDYRYVGNAKTNNFYPSDSYPARGTEAKYRRFFENKQAALDAGFNASKLVKD